MIVGDIAVGSLGHVKGQSIVRGSLAPFLPPTVPGSRVLQEEFYASSFAPFAS